MPHDFQADIDAIGRIAAVPMILDLVCRVTGLRFAAVARVTEDRWVTCQALDQISFGLKPGDELKVETTICNEIRQSGQRVVIDHVAEDAAFQRHHTPALYGFQSYISVPILRADGRFFGTLCAIDPLPAKLRTPEIIGMFTLFAELIAAQLDAGERLLASESDLTNERRVSELREQFIAVLGHDLRNPVAAIGAGATMLARLPLELRAQEVVQLIQGTTVRMAGLVDNLLDFARGRLGGGLTLTRSPQRLEPVLRQVLDELKVLAPSRQVTTRFDLAEAVDCDPTRIAQLFSNLLGNAFTHGGADTPIEVVATARDGAFVLSVGNSGEPIPAGEMDSLFQPFARGKLRSSREGLGLGLYIASEIARAHGGLLTVTSTAADTRFTFRMPLTA